jgi:hypothetical protein
VNTATVRSLDLGEAQLYMGLIQKHHKSVWAKFWNNNSRFELFAQRLNICTPAGSAVASPRRTNAICKGEFAQSNGFAAPRPRARPEIG